MTRQLARIGFVHSTLKFGGAERVTLNLAHELKRRGFEVDILLMTMTGELLEEAKLHFNVVDLDCSRTWKLPGRLIAYLRSRRPCALVPSFWKLNLCACIARFFSPSTKLVLWEHAPPSSYSPTVLYFLTASLFYQLATRVVAVSNGVAADIKRITVGLSRKIEIIYNAIPPPPAETRRGHPSPVPRIIWVGRLSDPKNPSLMLEAFAKLNASGTYHLDFLGEGGMRSKLEARTQELGLEASVRFLGFRSNSYEHITCADLLALSSDQEGLPTVLIEALNAGIGVVSTDCGEGVHEILMEDVYGTIVPVKDAQALANAISKELANPRDRAAQREGGKRFDPSVVAEQFVAAIDVHQPSRGKTQ